MAKPFIPYKTNNSNYVQYNNNYSNNKNTSATATTSTIKPATTRERERERERGDSIFPITSLVHNSLSLSCF